MLSEEPEAYFRVGPQVDLLQRPEAGAAVAKQDARSRLMMRRRHHQEPNARQPQHLPQHSLEQLLDEGHAAAVAAVAAAAGDPAANHQAAPSVRSVRCSGVFRQRDGWEAQLCLDNKVSYEWGGRLANVVDVCKAGDNQPHANLLLLMPFTVLLLLLLLRQRLNPPHGSATAT